MTPRRGSVYVKLRQIVSLALLISIHACCKAQTIDPNPPKEVVRFAFRFGFFEDELTPLTEIVRSDVEGVICQTQYFFSQIIQNATGSKSIRANAKEINWGLYSARDLPASINFTVEFSDSAIDDGDNDVQWVDEEILIDEMEKLGQEGLQDFIVNWIWRAEPENNFFFNVNRMAFVVAKQPHVEGLMDSAECPETSAPTVMPTVTTSPTESPDTPAIPTDMPGMPTDEIVRFNFRFGFFDDDQTLVTELVQADVEGVICQTEAFFTQLIQKATGMTTLYCKAMEIDWGYYDGFLALERQEASNQPCSIINLTDECPDEMVNMESLRAECIDAEHGINAAKCYMQYLCDYHDQGTVNQHKLCIDRACPLARHIPPLDCDAGGNEVPDDDDHEMELIEEEFTMNATQPPMIGEEALAAAQINFTMTIVDTTSLDGEAQWVDEQILINEMARLGQEGLQRFITDWVWNSEPLGMNIFGNTNRLAFDGFKQAPVEGMLDEVACPTSGLTTEPILRFLFRFGFFSDVPEADISEINRFDVEGVMCQTQLYLSQLLQALVGTKRVYVTATEIDWGSNLQQEFPLHVNFTAQVDDETNDNDPLVDEEILLEALMSLTTKEIEAYITDYVWNVEGSVFEDVMSVQFEGYLLTSPVLGMIQEAECSGTGPTLSPSMYNCTNVTTTSDCASASNDSEILFEMDTNGTFVIIPFDEEEETAISRSGSSSSASKMLDEGLMEEFSADMAAETVQQQSSSTKQQQQSSILSLWGWVSLVSIFALPALF